jgi:hypothetical protein
MCKHVTDNHINDKIRKFDDILHSCLHRGKWPFEIVSTSVRNKLCFRSYRIMGYPFPSVKLTKYVYDHKMFCIYYDTCTSKYLNAYR